MGRSAGFFRGLRIFVEFALLVSGVEESDENDDDGARASPRAVSEDSDSESEGGEEEESED